MAPLHKGDGESVPSRMTFTLDYEYTEGFPPDLCCLQRAELRGSRRSGAELIMRVSQTEYLPRLHVDSA